MNQDEHQELLDTFGSQDEPVDESQELLDVLNEQGERTGETKTRASIHQDGNWHRSFHLWVVNADNYVLLQRRSKKKDLEGGKIDVTVGGHYRAGETLEEVVREAEEEVGLFVRPDRLSHLLTQKAVRHYENATDREFQEIYVLEQDQPLELYYLNCEEVDTLYEIPLDRAIALYQDGISVPAQGWDCQQRNNNALLYSADLIEQARADVLEALQGIKVWLEKENAS